MLYQSSMEAASMAEESKALQLAVHCLSPPLVFENRPRHIRNNPVTLIKAVVITGYSGVLHHLELASSYLA